MRDIPGTTASAERLLGGMRDELLALLEAADALDCSESNELAAELHQRVENERGDSEADESTLAGLFVADRFIGLVAAYCRVWPLIADGQFSGSWLVLQDAMDSLRLVKRFSDLDVSFFESSLVELESAYPYGLFLSVGMRVEFFECSICGADIDSADCPHRRRELYQGVMACAIAREVAELDHVSLVEHPEDKRCVVQYEDDGPQFRLIRYIGELLAAGTFAPSALSRLEWSKVVRPNPDYVQLGRNETCFCGSGRKFKKCCSGLREIEGDHVEVIAEPRDVRTAVVEPADQHRRVLR